MIDALKSSAVVFASVVILHGVGRPQSGQAGAARDRRLASIHERFVFADIHAHPSAFHRANVEWIQSDELARYRRGLIDLVVCNVSSDAAYQGGYRRRDGTLIKRLQASC